MKSRMLQAIFASVLSLFGLCWQGVIYPETITVTSVTDESAHDPSVGAGTDTGEVTLRSALEYANHPYSDTEHTICFNIKPGGFQRIELDGPLDEVVKPVVINGYSQEGSRYADDEHDACICIELSGINAGENSDGLVITGSGKGSVIKGLVINDFPRHGIVLDDVCDVTVFGTYVGTSPDGKQARANGGHGIVVHGGTNNLIGGHEPRSRNLISGNTQSGVFLADSQHVRVCGNAIGVDIASMAALANGEAGLTIVGGGGHEIGGHRAFAGNIISGNGGAGVSVQESCENVLEGNHIGLDTAGVGAIANAASGVVIEQGSSGNAIGGTDSLFGNLISGNKECGVLVIAADENRLLGNCIGLNAQGNVLPNEQHGVVVGPGASRTIVGGMELGTGNIISGNSGSGIVIEEAFNTVIKGNSIGVDGEASTVANTDHGILVRNAQGTMIGGVAIEESNIISGNRKFGIKCDGGCSNTVIGNALYANNRRWAIQLINNANNDIAAPKLYVDKGIIHGTLHNVPHEEYIVCFYSNTVADRKEGASFLGQQMIKTNAKGGAEFRIRSVVPYGPYITATATRKATGDTSRFSNDVELQAVPHVTFTRTPITAMHDDDHYSSYTLTVLVVPGDQHVTDRVAFQELLPKGQVFVSVEQESGPEFDLKHPQVGAAGLLSGEGALRPGNEATFKIVVMKSVGGLRRMPDDEAYFGMSESILARGIAYKMREHIPLARQVISADGALSYEIELSSPFRDIHRAFGRTKNVYMSETDFPEELDERKDTLASPAGESSQDHDIVIQEEEELLHESDDSDEHANTIIRSGLIDEEELHRMKIDPLRYQNNQLSSLISHKWFIPASSERANDSEICVQPVIIRLEEEEEGVIELDDVDELPSSQEQSDLRELAVPFEYDHLEVDDDLGRYFYVEDYPAQEPELDLVEEEQEFADKPGYKPTVVPIFTQEELEYLHGYSFGSSLDARRTEPTASSESHVQHFYPHRAPWLYCND